MMALLVSETNRVPNEKLYRRFDEKIASLAERPESVIAVSPLQCLTSQEI